MLEAPGQCSPLIIMKRHTVTEKMKKLLHVWLQKNFQELLKCHTQALNKDMMQLQSHKVGKVTEMQKAEQHKRFNIKYLTDNFSMAERALASFHSRTQVGTGLPALAAVPNVTASCKMTYGEKKTANQQTWHVIFARKVNWKHEHYRKLASISAEYKEPIASTPGEKA